MLVSGFPPRALTKLSSPTKTFLGTLTAVAPHLRSRPQVATGPDAPARPHRRVAAIARHSVRLWRPPFPERTFRHHGGGSRRSSRQAPGRLTSSPLAGRWPQSPLELNPSLSNFSKHSKFRPNSGLPKLQTCLVAHVLEISLEPDFVIGSPSIDARTRCVCRRLPGRRPPDGSRRPRRPSSRTSPSPLSTTASPT